MCLWFPVADSNNSHQKTWSHKQKKREKGFSSKQKQHHLVCNDGLHPRLNSHAHNGYLIEFQSGWAQLKAMQYCTTSLQLPFLFCKRAADGTEMATE